MATLTEGRHAAEFVVSASAGTRSRETVTVLSGQNLKAGAVVGKVALGAGSAVADAGNTGDGTMGAITVGAGGKVGVYRLTVLDPATNAGAFQVEDPDGINVGTGDIAAAFTGGGLSFTLADGATDFAAGDGFNITVAAGTDKVKEWNPANTDGSDVVTGVLHDNVDATAADASGVIVARDAEVHAGELEWFTGATAGNITTGTAGLAALGIIAR